MDKNTQNRILWISINSVLNSYTERQQKWTFSEPIQPVLLLTEYRDGPLAKIPAEFKNVNASQKTFDVCIIWIVILTKKTVGKIKRSCLIYDNFWTQRDLLHKSTYTCFWRQKIKDWLYTTSYLGKQFLSIPNQCNGIKR